MKYVFAHTLLAAAFTGIGCGVCWFLLTHLDAPRDLVALIGLGIGVMWWSLAADLNEGQQL